MEIRPSGEAPIDIGVKLKGVLADLERRIDKTEIGPVTIRSAAEKQEIADAMIEDARQIADVEVTLKPYSDLAYNIHRSITGARTQYQSYANARKGIRDKAMTEWIIEQERITAAEDARLRDVARLEAEARQKEEADELKRRAKAEGRPDLLQRAKEVAAAPVREIAITSGRSAAAATTRGSGGGSVGSKKSYVVEITDIDTFILAAARPHIYREAIAALLKEHGKKKASAFVETLRAAIEDMPQIPLTTLDANEQKIKENAKATNGKINWPGVAIDEDRKSTTRK